MVTRNEADRFLLRSLGSLIDVCDAVAIFDDQSTDGTLDVITDFADDEPTRVRHARRADGEPSFAESEGKFRDVAWHYMESVLRPEPGDWILAIDADEVVIVDDPARLAEVLATADSDAMTVKIHELWQLQPPLERIDGYWDTITGVRLYRWGPGEHIADRDLACGSVPPVAPQDVGNIFTLRIAHLGYVRREDREAKHARYKGRRGHNHSHVESILTTPTLAPLHGGLP